jgi:hypothetical protein
LVAYLLVQPFLSHGGFSDGGWCREMLQEVAGSSAIRSVGIETGTKLYISNLEYGVSNEDIKVLNLAFLLLVCFLFVSCTKSELCIKI